MVGAVMKLHFIKLELFQEIKHITKFNLVERRRKKMSLISEIKLLTINRWPKHNKHMDKVFWTAGKKLEKLTIYENESKLFI